MTTWQANKGNYYYGARYYDPKVSVWLSVDPKADWYPSHTPFNFTLNNPVNLKDPNGKWVEGAGFFNNLFKSDEQNLARLLAEEKGGKVFKHNDAWRVSWASDNDDSENISNIALDELNIVDFKEGQDRGGRTDKNFFSFADRKIRSFSDGIFGAQSSVGSGLESLDRESAPMIAQSAGNLAAIWVPPLSVANGYITTQKGHDIFGNKKESTMDRYIIPVISMAGPLSKPGSVVNTLDIAIGVLNSPQEVID